MHPNWQGAGHKPKPPQQSLAAYQDSSPNTAARPQEYSTPLHSFQAAPELLMQHPQLAQNGHSPLATGVPINPAPLQHGSRHGMPYSAAASQPAWPMTSQQSGQAAQLQPPGLPTYSGVQQSMYTQQQHQQQPMPPVLPGYPQQAPMHSQITGSVTARTPSPAPMQASASPVASNTGRGFTANQLNVLRNQILAFRRIKASLCSRSMHHLHLC